MANFVPVTIALVATLISIYQQINLPFTLWLAQATGDNFPPRIFILISTFFLLLDNTLLPDRYRVRIPFICALIIDYLLAQSAMAVMLYVWTQFHSMLTMLLKELLLLENDTQHLIFYQLGGDIFLGYFTTAMSIITFWYTFKATGSKERLKATVFKCIDVVADICLKICDCSDDENDESNVAQSK